MRATPSIGVLRLLVRLHPRVRVAVHRNQWSAPQRRGGAAMQLGLLMHNDCSFVAQHLTAMHTYQRLQDIQRAASAATTVAAASSASAVPAAAVAAGAAKVSMLVDLAPPLSALGGKFLSLHVRRLRVLVAELSDSLAARLGSLEGESRLARCRTPSAPCTRWPPRRKHGRNAWAAAACSGQQERQPLSVPRRPMDGRCCSVCSSSSCPRGWWPRCWTKQTFLWKEVRGPSIHSDEQCAAEVVISLLMRSVACCVCSLSPQHLASISCSCCCRRNTPCLTLPARRRGLASSPCRRFCTRSKA